MDPQNGVYWRLLTSYFLQFSHLLCGDPHLPLQIRTQYMGFSAQFPAKKAQGNLTPTASEPQPPTCPGLLLLQHQANGIPTHEWKST